MLNPLRIKLISSVQLLLLTTGLALTAQADTLPEHAVFQTTDTMRAETRFIDHALENLHCARAPIASLDMGAFLRNYIEQFDPFHLFFTEPEIKQLELQFNDSLPFYLKQGNLFPAFEIFAQCKEKCSQRIDWVLLTLDQPFNFETEGSFIPDRRKYPWPLTPEEADTLWTDRLQYDLLNEILGTKPDSETLSPSVSNWQDIPLWATVIASPIAQPGSWTSLLKHVQDTPLPSWSYIWLTKADRTPTAETAYIQYLEARVFNQTLTQARTLLKDRYKRLKEKVLDFEAVDIAEVFLATLTHQYDPHSTFFSADSMEEFSIAIRNSLVGIGAVLSDEDGYCTIRELIAGGPASKSKDLKPGDAIVGIAQGSGPMVDVIGLKLREVVRMIRGAKGTDVRLLIRPGEGDPANRKTITLVRDEVEITTSLAGARLYTLESPAGSQKIGVIDLPTFYGGDESDIIQTSTTADVEELINKLKAKGAQGLILDIRRNGGGLLTEAITLTGLFTTTGPVLQVKDTLGQLNEFLDENPSIAWSGPLIILVSRYSASASEILVGALKDQNRALIVGDPTTHGKGTVQAVLDIDRSAFIKNKKARMGSAKITIQKWYRPSGNSTQLKGVESDIILPSLNPYLPIGESDLPKALAWDAIRNIPWVYDTTYNIPEGTANLLNINSLNRQKTLPELLYLQESVDWFKKRQEEKSFSLNIQQRRLQKAAEEKFHLAMETKFKALDRGNFLESKVLLDTTLAAEKNKNSPTAQTADTPASTALGELSSESSLPDDTEGIDIHLRETLRIMSDWLALPKAAD